MLSFSQFLRNEGTDAHQLRTLPDDILALCFEQIDLQTLINIVDSDDALLEAANWAFCVNYGKRMFDIEMKFVENPHEFIIEPFPSSRLRSESVIINDFPTNLKLLSYFGRSITALNVDYDGMDANQIKLINNYISEFCIRLQTFDMMNCNETNLNDMHAMPSVENVSFSSPRLESIGDHLKRIYPNMQRLDVKNFEVSDSMCLARHYPRLKHLEIGFFVNGLNVRDVQAILQNNTQIQSLRTTLCPIEFLTVIKENLPNIETLELISPMTNFFRAGAQVVHFETIKTFVIHGQFIVDEFPFSFDPQKLREIRIATLDPSLGKWLNFIVRHKGLIKLDISHVSLCETDVITIAEQLPNLKEIKANFAKLTSSDQIVTFVKRCKHMNRLKLISPKRTIVEELKMDLANEWHFYFDETSKGQVLIVERKNQEDFD